MLLVKKQLRFVFFAGSVLLCAQYGYAMEKTPELKRTNSGSRIPHSPFVQRDQQLQQLKSVLAASQQQVIQLTQENTRLAEQVKEAAQKKTLFDLMIDCVNGEKELTEQNEQLTKQVTELTCNAAHLTQEKNQLEVAHNQLREEKEDLEKKLRVAQEEKTTLERQNTELVTTNNELEQAHLILTPQARTSPKIILELTKTHPLDPEQLNALVYQENTTFFTYAACVLTGAIAGGSMAFTGMTLFGPKNEHVAKGALAGAAAGAAFGYQVARWMRPVRIKGATVQFVSTTDTINYIPKIVPSEIAPISTTQE